MYPFGGLRQYIVPTGVGSGWVKSQDGKWDHKELHEVFIANLRKKQKFVLVIWSCELGVFAVRELLERQRKWTEQKRR